MKGYLAKSEDPDRISQKVPFHQGLHCLQRLDQSLGTIKPLYLEILTCDPCYDWFIVSSQMVNSSVDKGLTGSPTCSIWYQGQYFSDMIIRTLVQSA